MAKGFCEYHYKKAREKKETPSVIKKKHQAKQVVTADNGDGKPRPAGKTPDHRLVFDMTHIPGATGIIEKVRKLADREFRPVEYQVAILLRDSLDESRPAVVDREAING